MPKRTDKSTRNSRVQRSARQGGSSASSQAHPKRSTPSKSAEAPAISASHSDTDPIADLEAPKRAAFPWGRIVLVAVLALAAILVIRLVATATAVSVTINGQPMDIRGAKTVRVAAQESGVPLNPGDLISLHGVVQKKGAGYEFSAVVNGEPVDDLDAPLHEGDVVEVSDGADIVEDYDEVLQVIPHEALISGVGALRVYQGTGRDGMLSIRTGKLSGETLSKKVMPAEALVNYHYNPDVGDQKIVALTFDDGPSADYTAQILDVLAENDARATFFFRGSCVEEAGNADVVKRAFEEGHQVCSGIYSAGDDIALGGIGLLDEQAQQEEVAQAEQALANVLGTEPSTASGRVVRLPDEVVTADMMENLQSLIDVEVGWNTDTGDDLGISADEIASTLMDVTPGDIVVLRDGGGDRSATVKALKTAVPRLKRAGWQFVTIEDLMGYPAL